MTFQIKRIEEAGSENWDSYVLKHPNSNLYQLSGWKNVIEESYGHSTYYLIAIHSSKNYVAGVLPMVHLKHFLFGNSLISIPFFDMGGILSDDEIISKALLSEALNIGRKLGVNEVELRHTHYFNSLKKNINLESDFIKLKTDKVRMLIELPDSSEKLMKSFKSKLRSQIKKPIKEGLKYEIGGIELLNDFYKVFLINMRDLGSPVHSRTLLKHVLQKFSDTTRIVLVKKEGIPLAGSIITGFKNTLENPWASSLRKYSRLSPNMLLYWAMLEYACDHGFKYFDFGRSTPKEGTYRFKKQWGAEPVPLHWQYFSLNKNFDTNTGNSEKTKFNKAIQYWQKLPVFVTKFLGPMIRKNIGL